MADRDRAGICLLAGDAALCLAGADQHMESDICNAGEILSRADGDFIACLSDLYCETQAAQKTINVTKPTKKTGEPEIIL